MTRFCDYRKDDLWEELKEFLSIENYTVGDVLEVLTDVIKAIEVEKEE